MKLITALKTTLILGLTLSAVGQAASFDHSRHEGVKALVCYFSRYDNTVLPPQEADNLTGASIVIDEGKKVGNTAFIAGVIADDLKADVFSIKTKTLLPGSFNELMDLNHQEQRLRSFPEVQEIPQLTDYDVIFIGYPIWAMEAPRAVSTFIQSLSLEGKKVVFFCSHDGYGAGSSLRTLSAQVQGGIVESKALVLKSDEVAHSAEAILEFVHSLSF